MSEYLTRYGLRDDQYRPTHTYCPMCALQLRKLKPKGSEAPTERPDAGVALPNGQINVIARILDLLAGTGGSELEAIVRTLPDLSWNQVFAEVDRLSRDGHIKLTYLGHGRYQVELGHSERTAAGFISDQG